MRNKCVINQPNIKSCLMSYDPNLAPRARLLNGSKGYDQVAMNAGNEMLVDSLGDKSSKLLNIAKGIRESFKNDEEQLISLSTSMDKSANLVSKAKGLVTNIVDDPTPVGVMKIASLVFTSLCVLYFGGKLIYRLLSR